MNTQLCRSCIACFGGTARQIDVNEAQFYVHHATPSSFADAVKEGCELCQEFWTKSNDSNSSCSGDLWKGCEVHSTDDVFTCVRFTAFTMDLHGVYFKKVDNIVGPRLRSFYRVIVREKNMLPSETFLKESQARVWGNETTKSHTGDPSVMSQLTRWMEACKSHPQCSPNIVTRHLPTRLVDLSLPTGVDMFRVWCTTEDSHVTYCTLSHCWGDGKGILKLEKSTLGEPIRW